MQPRLDDEALVPRRCNGHAHSIGKLSVFASFSTSIGRGDERTSVMSGEDR